MIPWRRITWPILTSDKAREAKVDCLVGEVIGNSVAVAILRLTFLPPDGNRDLHKRVPELLDPIRREYKRESVTEEELESALSFLKEKCLVNGVSRKSSITCSLTPLGEDVARALFSTFLEPSSSS